MHDKIKSLLHMAAVFAIFIFTHSFCSEVIGMAFRIFDCVRFILVLYICLDILNVWIAVFLYSKYVLKMHLSEMYLGKPLPVLRDCIGYMAVPFVIDAAYFIFTKGEFKIGCCTKGELVSILFHEVFSSGFRTALTEGIIFRGMLFRIVQKGFGNKAGILISNFFYAAASFIFYNSFAWNESGYLAAFLLAFLLGLTFTLITFETGSVWLSVVIHFLYNTLSGNSYILHITARQDFPAIFTYTVKSGGILFTDIPAPSIAVFLILVLMVLIHRKRGGSRAMINEGKDGLFGQKHKI